MGILSRAFERRGDGDYASLTSGAAWLWDMLAGDRTDAGIRVNPRTALKFSTAYACINVLAQTAAQVPWDVFRKDGKKRQVATDRTEHYLLHHQPIPTMSSYNFRMAMMAQALLGGNFYGEIIRDGAARVKAIRPLHWWNVQVYESLDEMSLVYKVTRRNGQMDTLDGSDVIHLPCLSLDGIAGLSPIEQHKQSIGMGLAAQQAANSFYANGFMASGFFSTPKPVRPQEREEFEKKLQNKFGGSRNKGKTPLFGGDVKWNAVSMPPSDALFLEAMDASKKDVAAIYRVPAVLVGLDEKSAAFASVDAFFLSYVKFSFTPWAQAIEQEFNRKLFPNRDDIYCKLDLNGLLRGDAKARAMFYKDLWITGALSANDLRELEEMDPIDGGDRHFVQSGFVPLDRIDDVVDKMTTVAPAKQDPQAGGTDSTNPARSAARSAHVTWLEDVVQRVSKWERKDEARIAEAMLPVFRSFQEEIGKGDAGGFCMTAASRTISDPLTAAEMITLFEES